MFHMDILPRYNILLPVRIPVVALRGHVPFPEKKCEIRGDF